MDSIIEQKSEMGTPDSPSQAFSKSIWSLSGEVFHILPEGEQIEKRRYFWKGVNLLTLPQLGIEKYLPDFAGWVKEGILQDLDREDQFSPEDQQVWETRRRIVYQMLLGLHKIDTRLAPKQIRMLKDFMDAAKRYLPRSLNPLKNIKYGDRVPITLVLLTKEILQRNGTATRVYTDYSLTEMAVNNLYQFGWKYGFSISSRAVSRFLSERIRDRDMPSISEIIREENIRTVLKDIDGYTFAEPLLISDLQEINTRLTHGLVPEGFEGAFRDYEGQMSTSDRMLVTPPEIKPAIVDLFSEVHQYLKEERLLGLSREAKDEYILHLAAYVCAKINELKPFLEANGRLGYVMAEWVLRRANSTDAFDFPGIFDGRRNKDYLEYYQAVDETVRADQPLRLNQTHGLQPLVNFFEKRWKKGWRSKIN